MDLLLKNWSLFSNPKSQIQLSALSLGMQGPLMIARTSYEVNVLGLLLKNWIYLVTQNLKFNSQH